jgi:N-acetylmuramoyl-L-alanine amidase
MQQELQTIVNITKDNTVRSRQLELKLGFLLVVAFLTLGIFHGSAMAASGLRIYNYTTKKESTYTDKQIKVIMNGKTVTKEQMPGILVSGIAMVPYNDVFEKSEIAAECNYDKSEGTISISKYGKTLQMTIGSKKAKLNGQTVNLPVAPMKIKFMKDGLIKVLVPSRFISETLGLKYTWISNKSTVTIEKTTLMLSYNGAKKFEYTGVLGKVTVNGKNINLGNMPSIITNNTAMLRAKWVFSNPAIGATYNYDNAKKKLTLTKGSTVLEMTVGDKTAYLNGNATKMDTAPMIIKNYSSGVSYLMVPGSFTASCLGFNYKWDNATRTSIITSQQVNNPGNSGGSGNSPELGDSGVIIETGTVLNQWVADTSVYSLSTELHELNEEAVGVNPAVLTSVTRDNSIVKKNAETFMIVANGSMGKITSSKSDKQLQVQVANLSATDMTYPMYGIYSNYVNTIGTYANPTGQTTIMFDVLSSEYTYDLSLSQDKQTLYVTVYYNSLTQAVIGTNNAGDYVTLTGIKPLKVTMNQSTGYLNIDLPYTTNGIGDIYTNLVGSKYINLFYTIGTLDKTQIVIGVNEGYEYYISEVDNKYSILFLTAGTVQQPPTDTPAQPGLSDQVDPNECEIIIPKPDGLNTSMITDEDYYFEKSFVLRLSGDFTGSINSSNIISTSGRVEDIRVNLNSNNETEIRIKTSKLQGYEYTMDDKNIYINIGDPKDIYPNIVILDPGHGGGANGAQYYDTKEKDLNYKILYTIGKKYFNQDTSKLKVYYTRIKDVDMSLSDRAAFAGKYGADLFVSLHMNANLNRTVYGTEVYYSSSNNSPNRAGLTSRALADLLCNKISGNLGTKNRGSRAERYTVVHKNTVPAVLIELGFLSTESDFKKLSDPTFQDNAAKTIYETLLEVFGNYPTGR